MTRWRLGHDPGGTSCFLSGRSETGSEKTPLSRNLRLSRTQTPLSLNLRLSNHC